MTPRRFVLLDRDGTVIVERCYLSDPDGVELIPGVVDGLRRLSELGLGLAVVTNQSGVARGMFDLARLALIHDRMSKLLATEGVHLDGIYWCPHAPEEACQCRKPRPGLVEQAARELYFDPRAAFVVGDKVCDIELGRGVGATTLLVRTGYGAREAQQVVPAPQYVVDDVREAALVIERIVRSGSSEAPNSH